VIPDELINKSIFLAKELTNEPILQKKQKILKQYHDSLTTGHSSIKETLRKVSEHHS